MKPRSFSRFQIYLIERHQGLRGLIGSQLQEEGYRIHGVGTLEEALSSLRETRRRPCLLILDTLDQPLSLEAMDSMPEDVPVLVLSGPLDRGGPLLLQRPQAVLLEKPFTIKELVDAVHKICYKEN